MAEAATVIGVVAAALQFADVARKVLKITREVREGSKPGPIHRRIKQLETFVVIADKISQTWTQEDPVTESILGQCTPTVTALLGQLDRLKISDSDGLAKKTKKAILSHLENKEVEDLFGQLRWDLAALGLHRDFSSTSERHTVEAILDGTRQLLDDRLKSTTGDSVFLRYMFITDPRDDREALISRKGRRADRTCTWVTELDAYRLWLSSTASTQGLIIEGGPGKGKSMIAIYLTEQLELLADHNHSVIYFFCDNRNPIQNNAVAVMRCLIWQLCRLKPTAIQYGTRELKERGGDIANLLGPSPSTAFETLWRIFDAMLRDVDTGTVCCVIDGLDECDEDSVFLILDKLSGLGSIPSFKFLVLSRPQSPRQRQPTRSGAMAKLRLDSDSNKQVHSDIDKFIRQRIAEISRSEKAWSQSLCQSVESVLREKAGGTFLWVGFVMQDLRQKRPSEIKSCLKQLPVGLDGIYDRILQELPREHRSKIRQILHWVCMAELPLKLSELSGLVSDSYQEPVSDSDTDGESGSDSFAVSDLDLLNDLIAFLGHFIVVSEETVYFVHQSAKDYLLRSESVLDPDLDFFRVVEHTTVHEHLARRCFEILKRGLPHIEPNDAGDKTNQYTPHVWAAHMYRIRHSDDKKHEYASFDYAAYSWKHHIRHSGDQFHDPDTLKTVMRLLNHSDTLSQKVVESMGWDLGVTDSRDLNFTSYLYDAIHLGLDGCLFQMIQSMSLEAYTSVVTETWSVRQKPLRAAMDEGSRRCFWHILDAFGCNAVLLEPGILSASVGPRRSEFFERLLAVSPNLRQLYGNDLEKALAVAIGYESFEQPKRLIAFGADINARDQFGNTLLHRAAMVPERYSHYCQKTVRFLLSQGADPTATNNQGQTPLHFAASERSIELVQYLIDSGACVATIDSQGDTALHKAMSMATQFIGAYENKSTAEECLGAMVNVLSKGMDINLQNNSGQTPLHLATTNAGNPVITSAIETLISMQADVNRKDGQGQTALHLAANKPNTILFQALLDAQTNVNCQDKEGQTALHLAAEAGRSGYVQALLNLDAEIGCRNAQGDTALHLAAKAVSSESILALLRLGAVVSSQNSKGQTALHLLAQQLLIRFRIFIARQREIDHNFQRLGVMLEEDHRRGQAIRDTLRKYQIDETLKDNSGHVARDYFPADAFWEGEICPGQESVETEGEPSA